MFARFDPASSVLPAPSGVNRRVNSQSAAYMACRVRLRSFGAEPRPVGRARREMLCTVAGHARGNERPSTELIVPCFFHFRDLLGQRGRRERSIGRIHSAELVDPFQP